MSRVDDVVGQIKNWYYTRNWHFLVQDDEARNLLDALAGLNSTEFKEAFDKSTIWWSWMNTLDVRQQLAFDAEDLEDDPKYADILKALSSGDPTAVVDAKKEEEAEKEEKAKAGNPEFADYGFDKFKNEEKHAHYVDLYEPKGASEALKLLIRDTEFFMQRGFDTLGSHDPKAAPDPTNVLDGEQVTTASGWSKIRDAHQELKEQLDKRRTEYIKAHESVQGTTYESAKTGSAIFNTLKGITDELNERLEYEISGTTHTGNKITESSGGPPISEMQVTVYEKNADEKSDDFGKYLLTAEAEQRYYVRNIDEAVEKWETAYAAAIKEFQEKSATIDKENSNDKNNNKRDNWNGVSNNSQNTVTQPTGLREDFSSTFDDLGLGSTESTASLDGIQPSLGGASDDTPSSMDPSSLIQAAMQGSGNGWGTSNKTADPTGSASNDNGAGALGQLAMISALGNMANQGGRQPGDDRGHDDRDSREARQLERNRTAPAPTADPDTQAPTPPVTAPAYAGGPPPITAPDAMVDVTIGDTKVEASQPVADALRNQIQNVALDAKSAYEGTAGENIPGQHPWATVDDVARLKTGDTVEWDNNGAKHYGLIVRKQNGLLILDNGQLIPFDPNSPPLIEKYGNFTGYFHPTGLDVAGNADPGSAAPAPATVSAAQPAGPPPVGPPQV
ncbi:hypothetical protein OH799_00980 [Nocardia sp. NBC_00881]|uniref:hypothetical protein n=1 Tax=Nocardia sp. NBC_00881 TaxID=2975995 RepID=UPI00386D708E|nr:hypothetical protein OH799_00980 [Nocardia sp. NBC_00881]